MVKVHCGLHKVINMIFVLTRINTLRPDDSLRLIFSIENSYMLILQTHSRVLIHFTNTWLKCTISISLKLESKGNITTKSHGCLKVWKIPSNKRINFISNLKRSILLTMMNYIKVTRENCSSSWKWLKNVIIMICLLSIVMIWKNPGVL